MKRWLLLLLMLTLPWQGAWASEIKPCLSGGGCGGEHDVAALASSDRAAQLHPHAVADAGPHGSGVSTPDADDGLAQDRCNGDCQACHGLHLPALLGELGLHLWGARHTGNSPYLRSLQQQHPSPLLRPPQPAA